MCLLSNFMTVHNSRAMKGTHDTFSCFAVAINSLFLTLDSVTGKDLLTRGTGLTVTFPGNHFLRTT